MCKGALVLQETFLYDTCFEGVFVGVVRLLLHAGSLWDGKSLVRPTSEAGHGVTYLLKYLNKNLARQKRKFSDGLADDDDEEIATEADTEKQCLTTTIAFSAYSTALSPTVRKLVTKKHCPQHPSPEIVFPVRVPCSRNPQTSPSKEPKYLQ
jgi:hypothetical protein